MLRLRMPFLIGEALFLPTLPKHSTPVYTHLNIFVYLGHQLANISNLEAMLLAAIRKEGKASHPDSWKPATHLPSGFLEAFLPIFTMSNF